LYIPVLRIVTTGTHTTEDVADTGGRLTLTIVDSNDVAIHFAGMAMLGVAGRTGMYGAEIPGTGFKVVALAEVQDAVTSPFMPYMDYYDAAPTPAAGGGATTSFGGSFYDK